MTRDQAEVLEAELFDGCPGVAELLIESQHGKTADRRHRAWMAMLALDPDRSLPMAWPENADIVTEWRLSRLAEPAQVLADLILVSFYGSRAEHRIRAARLLGEVCREGRRLTADAA